MPRGHSSLGALCTPPLPYSAAGSRSLRRTTRRFYHMLSQAFVGRTVACAVKSAIAIRCGEHP